MNPSPSVMERLRRAWTHGLSAYGVALVATAVALLLNAITAAVSGGTNMVFVVLAVGVSAWRGGLGPGLLSALLSWLAFLLWLPPPSFPLADSAGEPGRLALAAAAV